MNQHRSFTRLIHSLTLAAAFCLSATTASASTPAERLDNFPAIKEYNLSPDKVGLGGHDPVGYFTDGKAIKGSRQFQGMHRGVTYFFASEASRTRFLESPEKFVPAYGGWCATAMAKGEKVEVDPATFKVSNGRLFLFFKAFYANALKDWNKDEARLTARADEHWRRISGE